MFSIAPHRVEPFAETSRNSSLLSRGPVWDTSRCIVKEGEEALVKGVAGKPPAAPPSGSPSQRWQGEAPAESESKQVHRTSSLTVLGRTSPEGGAAEALNTSRISSLRRCPRWVQCRVPRHVTSPLGGRRRRRGLDTHAHTNAHTHTHILSPPLTYLFLMSEAGEACFLVVPGWQPLTLSVMRAREPTCTDIGGAQPPRDSPPAISHTISHTDPHWGPPSSAG
jgi:hypothetical protein